MSSAPPPGSEVGSEPVPRRPRRILLFALVAVLVLAADLTSKVLVVATIQPDRAIRLLGGALYLVQARNSGAAFSVGTGATVALTAVAVLVVAVIVRAARRLRSVGWAIALGLVLGGALGNLTDRFFRSPAPGKGHVVDWISLFAADGHIWPIFNVADSCIVIGGCLAVLISLLGIDLAGHRSAKSGRPAQPHRQRSGG
ncbi:MAG: signal peptidase II [Jatrophihabitantaceae bacterium]